MDRLHQIIGLALRRADRLAHAHRAQHASARRDDLRAVAARAGVKYLARQPCRDLETVNRIALR